MAQNKIPTYAKWLPKPIKNYLFPTKLGGGRIIEKENVRNLSTYITPVQLQRIRHDVQLWREAIAEAEQAFYPHRVRMQRMFIDTILNGHTKACWNKRKDQMLLKDFKIVIDGSDKELEDTTKLFHQKWFELCLNYILDAQAFGYTLISLGDVVEGQYKDISPVRRWNISPDRLNVTSYVYSLSGENFLEEPYKDWHVWVTTPSEIGVSKCGYGLLYDVAMYEILGRNILAFNADAAELYGQPIRVGKTMKTNEDERAEYAQALSQMGNMGWILLDSMDEIELMESKSLGQGYKIYESLEQRIEKKISKIILGHADAMDSTPGKLGGGQGEQNPVYEALQNIATKDCRFVENVVNGELLPRMRLHGFPIPENAKFCFKNDAEKEELRKKEDASNKVTADIFKTIKDAGGSPDWEYFSKRTGIKVEKSEPIAPATPFKPTIQNRLNEIYR